jgi:hypothetical protein
MPTISHGHQISAVFAYSDRHLLQMLCARLGKVSRGVIICTTVDSPAAELDAKGIISARNLPQSWSGTANCRSAAGRLANLISAWRGAKRLAELVRLPPTQEYVKEDCSGSIYKDI